jgi:hypothetical protein
LTLVLDNPKRPFSIRGRPIFKCKQALYLINSKHKPKPDLKSLA